MIMGKNRDTSTTDKSQYILKEETQPPTQPVGAVQVTAGHFTSMMLVLNRRTSAKNSSTDERILLFKGMYFFDIASHGQK